MQTQHLQALRLSQLWNLAGLLTLARLPLAICFSFVAHRWDLALLVLLRPVLYSLPAPPAFLPIMTPHSNT